MTLSRFRKWFPVMVVAKLADELNHKGAKWDYTISHPTSSNAYKT
jgi:hypothetical protein